MVEQSRAKGRKSLASLHVRVERVTSRSAEPLWLSKPGADIVSRKVGTPAVLNLYG